ncbi:MAG: hypothetical protein RLZZ474_1542 [Bacteroidota bacterium]|jgi:hypothetical protein
MLQIKQVDEKAKRADEFGGVSEELRVKSEE